MRLIVSEAGSSLYSYGAENPADAQLLRCAESLENMPVQVSAGERSMYLSEFTAQGETVRLALFGTPGEYTGTGLKLAAALSGLMILFAIFLSILLTNRFLTRFVFRRVEEPLELPRASAASARAIWNTGSTTPGKTNLPRCAKPSTKWRSG